MIYGSVCSGIEAASAAWHPLGWEASFVSEIEPFPRAVLAHHYPEVPLHGDFTTIQDKEYRPIDLLVGGTPCQSFSIAGLRGGLDDDRGNLALEFLKLAKRLRPRWVVWENVPGVLSSNGGRDFGSILAGLGEVGYGFAYRVLDAQYFGLAQRRKRVFVVGYLGDWRPAAAVLFEREGLRGDTAPSRKKGEANTASLRTRAPGAGGQGTDWEHVVSHTLAARSGSALCAPDIQTYLPIQASGFECGPAGGRFIDLAPTLDTKCQNGPRQNQSAAGVLTEANGTQAYSIMPMNSGKDYKARPVDVAQPIMAAGPTGGNQGGDVIVQAVAFGAQNSSNQGDGVSLELVPTLDKSKTPGVMTASAVRRLTPTECERLQGFPDGYTAIPWRNKSAAECPDGPRYKALGNSMAVPVMRWIGKRIQKVEAEGYLK